jgi:hypothetical protein
MTNLNGDIVFMPWCYFRAPLSTLQHNSEDEGMGLIDVAAKFHTVILKSVWLQRNRGGPLTGEWLNV